MLDTPADQGGTKRVLFVISQVGGKGSPERRRADEVFDYIVEPVALKLGLEALRSDKDPTPGPITTQIIRGIVDSTVVVADLTGQNPNVFLEVGVAQSFARPLVLLIKEASALPFDVKGERTIEIGDGEVLGARAAEAAGEELLASLRIVLAHGYEASNLVTEAARARSLDDLAPTNPIAAELAAIRLSQERVEQTIRQTFSGFAIAPTDARGQWAALSDERSERLTEQGRHFTAVLLRLLTNEARRNTYFSTSDGEPPEDEPGPAPVH